MTGLPPLDDDSFLATARAAIASETAVILMTDGGSICGQVQPLYFAGDHVALGEIWWNATDGSGPALLDALEAWGREHGASLAMMSGDTEARANALQRLLGARGYSPLNFVMKKDI
jgi:hypothetical protein